MIPWCVRLAWLLAATAVGERRDKESKIARVSGSLKLAAKDEKDLSTSQSTACTHAWLPRADGDSRRTQYPQAAAGQGTRSAGDLDTAEATRLAARAPDFAFRTTDRLHRRSEYLRIHRVGARVQTSHFVIYTASTSSSAVRLGITVARRTGGAVVRNRVKRRVRECFRLTLRGIVPAGTDLVVIARNGAGNLTSAAIREELVAAVRKARPKQATS
jgi:ribonuclease P protein component